MSIRQKFAHSHISKELAKKLGMKRRSTQIRKGDTVKVMVGDNAGKGGKVNKVNLKRSKVFIEGITVRTAKGKEIMIPISSSNIYITELELSDKLRKAKLGIKA